MGIGLNGEGGEEYTRVLKEHSIYVVCRRRRLGFWQIMDAA
jgi:hypothetical protein